MSTKRSMWMAKDEGGTLCLFVRKPYIDTKYKGWQSNKGMADAIKDIFPSEKYRAIISKTIKKPWRESRCRVFITIKEARPLKT